MAIWPKPIVDPSAEAAITAEETRAEAAEAVGSSALATHLADPLAHADLLTAKADKTDSRFPATPVPYAQITKPFLTSHRGSSNVHPEESLAAYDACMNWPMVNTLEGDTNVLSDGTLIMLHDTTLDRTTDHAGGLGTLTLPQWRAINVDDQDVTVAPWADARPPTVEELFRRYGKRAYYNLGPKNGNTSNAALLAMIQKYGLDKYVLWGPSDVTGYNFWKNTGVPMFWGYNNGQDIPTMQQGKLDGVLCTGFASINATDFANAHAAGLMVAANLDYRAVAAPAIVAGTDGITTGDAMWMSGLNPVATSDPYSFKRYWYGCWAFGSSNRGKFLGTNRWGVDDASATWVLQGWGSPVPKSLGPVWNYAAGTWTNRTATYPWTITFTQTLDRVAPASGNSEAGCAFGCIDDGSIWNFGGKVTGQGGSGSAYYATINEDGTLNVYKRVNNTVSLLQTTATPALSAGQTATIKITMTSAASFTVQRTDGTPSTILTVNDGTLRGGYFRFGHNIDSGWSWSAVALG
jgi:hypothetical protein